MEGNLPSRSQVFGPELFSGVVELSAVIITAVSLNFVGVVHSFVRPAGQISHFVRRNIHGLSERRLAREQPWCVIQARLVKFLLDNDIVAVIGVGRDIMDLISELPELDHVAYYNLSLPTWRERVSEPYSATHAAFWRRYTSARRPACCDSRHLGFNPSIAYSQKNEHKTWYQVHCSLKDCFYMLCSLRAGVPVTMERNYTAKRSVATPSAVLVKEEPLEGLSVSSPEFSPLAIRLASEFIRSYCNSAPYVRLGLLAPVFPPLFDQTLEDSDKSRELSRIFNLAAQRQMMADFRRHRRTSIHFPLLRQIAADLGSANFCTVTIDADSLPRQTVILATTEAHRNLPQHVKVYQVPLSWSEALNSLRQIRKENPAALTCRIVIENVFRSLDTGRAKRVTVTLGLSLIHI